MPFSDLTPDSTFAPLSRAYLQDERNLARSLVEVAALSDTARADIRSRAITYTTALIDDAKRLATIDAFLREYSLSSDEGIMLMRLAESLIRTPDQATAAYLLRDKLLAGAWDTHLRAGHPVVTLGTLGLQASKAWVQLTGGVEARHLIARLGDRVMLAAVRSAIGILGRHFVLGTDIVAATKRAKRNPESTYSYDMLGEAALTQADADRYFEAYRGALQRLARTSPTDQGLHQSPGLSVKLSALHPRYEYARRAECVPALESKLLELCEIAKAANLGLTIDAEEVDRLEVSLLVFERLLRAPSLVGWDGLGLAIQAYQRRAIPVIDWIETAARKHQRRITVRLVKGAYWDSEIKRAQALGLASYPVFTRKEHTDISYLACARKLLLAADVIYPQFATHNALTAAAIVQMAGTRRDMEFQRLHGMSDGLHQRLTRDHGFASRTYAPVGRHEDLLPYLVRRLLENGANSSFVNQLLAANVNVETLIEDPIQRAANQGFAPHPALPDPRVHMNGDRAVAAGHDLSQADVAAAHERLSSPAQLLSAPPQTPKQAVQTAASSDWPKMAPAERSALLRKAADLLEAERAHFMARCVYEAGKTWPDAEAELREAVDFLRYYADQAERPEIASREPLGPVTCISPWNFPLAIFLGQVSAALSVGNPVLAKPAEQTPQIAIEAIDLLHRAGIPHDAVQVMIGDGRMGAALVAEPDIQAVCFTGSTETAKKIAQTLAATGHGERPLIAETGGINAMLVDSTALLEQAVQDVVRSAFQSAGQRCSACRLVCVQDDVADAFIAMLSGAMAELRTEDPAHLSSDLGPLIDTDAYQTVAAHLSSMRARFPVIGEAPAPKPPSAPMLAPIAFELNDIADLTEEIFGPVLHVVRYKGSKLDTVLSAIHALGFGLTMGLHTRVDARIAHVRRDAKVGNLYVNRDQIGAVVGQQPFGGEGLSGTGPKAGGPNYLLRLSKPFPGQARAQTFDTIALPGPTGERNTLTYHPRGTLLCLGGDSDDILRRQIERVEASGNIAITASADTLETAVARADIHGVVADGQRRDGVAKILAQRPGAILPLLSAEDDDIRFVIERVVTIDTTAAGGNATLLATI